MLDRSDIKAMDMIVADLVARNLMNGATMDEAKNRSFNRLANEYPVVFTAWLESR